MSEHYDILIKGSRIVDGTGKAAFKGSIGVKGEKIVAVGNVKGDAAREIDASGIVACPGFIDIHNHACQTIVLYPLAENYVMQGLTTFVGGNCGGSPAPIKDFISSGWLSRWWNEIEPHTYGPPYFLPLDKYRRILEEKLGFAIDWRTFGEFLTKVEKTGISVNYVPLVGHNAVRLAAMGMDFQRRAKPAEIEEMKKHVDEAMRSGAHGLTTNLDGVPGVGEYANTEEVIELAKVAQKYGGIYATHWRNFDNDYPAPQEEWGYGICHNITPEEMPVSKYYALLEAIEIGRKAKIPVQLSHICPVYLIYQYYPEYLQEAAAKATLEIIDKAREEGLDVAFDLAPADSEAHSMMMSAATLTALFPKWLVKCGSVERFVENLKIEAFRDELKKEWMNGKFKILMIHPKTDSYWMDRPYIVSCKNKGYIGKTIAQLSSDKNTDPMDTIFDMIIEDPDTKFTCTDPRYTEAAIRVFAKHPLAMLGSDISATPSLAAPPAGLIWAGTQRGIGFYGAYPRYIRRFVKENVVLTLEEAVKKATYLPAQRLKLKERGVISPGAYADILVFNFEKISEKGTVLNPRQAPEGIVYTLVNGKVVYEKMAHTGAKPGKVIRRK
jgi:N-acyl-D-aspartate/D-glutamate deacylase